MFRDWLPRFCSRLHIFLSYASPNRAIAEKIAQILKNSGHRVFFDKESLPPAADYNERIRIAISSSDRFVFLASRDALDHGKFTLTELDFAKQKWPSPVGRVMPVLIDPGLKAELLPTYLSSVQALSISGNAPAEIAAALEKSAKFSSLCWKCVGLSGLALCGVVAVATGIIPIHRSLPPAVVVLADPQYVHFRPRARPPNVPNAEGADTNWTASPLTITLPISFRSANAGSAPAQIVRRALELRLGDRVERYSRANVVKIRGDSVAQTMSMCNGDWSCNDPGSILETLEPGKSVSQEIMFLPPAGAQLTWKAFIDAVLAVDGPADAMVKLTAEIASADGSARPDTMQEVVCRLDIVAARRRMIGAKFSSGQDPRPVFWQPECETK